MDKSEYLTVKQAAEVLGVNPRTIFRLVDRGGLEKHVFAVGTGRGGTRVYFKKLDVERLASQEISTESNEPKAMKKVWASIESEPQATKKVKVSIRRLSNSEAGALQFGEPKSKRKK